METVNRSNRNEAQVISAHDFPADITAMIEQQIARLKREYSYLLDCQLTATVPAMYNTGTYRIQIVLTLPNQELKIDREPTPDYYQEDIYVAIWSAFDLARKKLQLHTIPTDCAVSAIPVPNICYQPIRGIRRCCGYAKG